MCFDCIQRKEHIIWLVIMVILFPIGAIAYYFLVKNKSERAFSFASGAPKEVETEDTLELKDLINRHHKAYHYDKLGQLLLEQKKYSLAQPQFREAIKKDPDMLDSRYGLAKCLHGMEKYAEAAEVLEELIKADKKYDYGNAIFGLAECYRLAGMDEKALTTYEAVIDSFHFFKAYHYYAQLLDKRGKKQEAIDIMKSVIASSKNLPDYKLEKERYWIDEAYKFLRKNGVELV
jgi:hypothetical protein